MAKRARKEKTEAERAEIEADRLAAHAEVVDTFDGVKLHEEPTPEDVKAYEEQQAEVLAEVERRIAYKEDHAEEGGISDSAGQSAEEGGISDSAGQSAEENEVEDERVPNSIVKDKFKVKYAENAAAIGDKRKQVKRSNWDWLAQQLAVACLSDKGKIDIDAFKDVLDANGVDHSRWTNKNKGWEGRFRMTGRVALQKVVANNGKLITPGGTELEAPSEWCDRYKTKA
jgi:hypothetical protein